MDLEPKAGAGQGMGFKGEDEGNLWGKKRGPSTLLLTYC